MDTIDLIKKRSELLSLCRLFFAKKAIIEVDCPCLGSTPTLDRNIEIFEVKDHPKRYLHSSPEYAMKRLLSKGAPSIYQISHVFRKNEKGRYHNPEFSLIEWYVKEISYPDFIDQVIELVRIFVKPKEVKHLSYRQAFLDFVHIDPFLASLSELKNLLVKENCPCSPALFNKKDRDLFLDLIGSHIMQPNMEKDILYIIEDYPPTQAALAQIKEKNGTLIAERFEIFYNSIELGNGYHELTDAKEQKDRFEKTKKASYSLDKRFLEALEKGIGDCYGIAMGFDRLLMLHLNKDSLQDVLPFSYDDI